MNGADRKTILIGLTLCLLLAGVAGGAVRAAVAQVPRCREQTATWLAADHLADPRRLLGSGTPFPISSSTWVIVHRLTAHQTRPIAEAVAGLRSLARGPFGQLVIDRITGAAIRSGWQIVAGCASLGRDLVGASSFG